MGFGQLVELISLVQVTLCTGAWSLSLCFCVPIPTTVSMERVVADDVFSFTAKLEFNTGLKMPRLA